VADLRLEKKGDSVRLVDGLLCHIFQLAPALETGIPSSHTHTHTCVLSLFTITTATAALLPLSIPLPLIPTLAISPKRTPINPRFFFFFKFRLHMCSSAVFRLGGERWWEEEDQQAARHGREEE
jgi:hypothetical protein